MNNDDQYVPTEGQVRAWCREGTGDYPDVMDEWLDRFLARVRRDAYDWGRHDERMSLAHAPPESDGGPTHHPEKED